MYLIVSPMTKVIQMIGESIEIATPPFPFLVDPPLLSCASQQPSPSDALEVQLINLTST